MSNLKEWYEKLYSGIIYDTMIHDIKWHAPFVLSSKIKPAWNMGKPLFGHAFTVLGHIEYRKEDIDDTKRIKMLYEMTPGCIQIMDTNANYSIALFGDISAKLARKFGCAGAVIDGNTRDLGIIEEDQFPLFCRGSQPDDAYGIWGIKKWQVPIQIDGIHGRVEIMPNDYIFGDKDGVIVIPRDIINDVCELAEKRAEKENVIRKKIDETDNILEIYNEFGAW